MPKSKPERNGGEEHPARKKAMDLLLRMDRTEKNLRDKLREKGGTLIVTPKDIDARVSDISKLVGYGINLALHDGLTVEDVDMFI